MIISFCLWAKPGNCSLADKGVTGNLRLILRLPGTAECETCGDDALLPLVKRLSWKVLV